VRFDAVLFAHVNFLPKLALENPREPRSTRVRDAETGYNLMLTAGSLSVLVLGETKPLFLENRS